MGAEGALIGFGTLATALQVEMFDLTRQGRWDEARAIWERILPLEDDEVVAAAQRVVVRVRLIAMLPNLEHLVRSGHVPQAAAWAARWVGLHPVVEVRSGRISPSRPALSDSAAHKAMLAAWRRTIPARPAALHVAALHSLAANAADKLLAGVRAEVEPAEAFVGSFGTVMLVHAGPGVAGLAWWWDGPDQA